MYKHSSTDLPFKLAYVRSAAADGTAKLLCVLKGYSSLSYGGEDFFFIPGDICELKCEEDSEEVKTSTFTHIFGLDGMLSRKTLVQKRKQTSL